MFEAVVALCVSLADGPCRDQLLPGYEAATEAGCLERLRGDGLSKARCVPVAEALTVTEVAPGVFVHEGLIAEPDRQNLGDVSNMGFIVGEDSVAVIDTGAARWLGEGLWRAIREQTDRPVSHVILTHMHPDHAFGVSVFADAGARVVGHAKLSRAMAERQTNYLESLNRLIGPQAMLGTEVRPIDVPVEDEVQVDLGGRSLSIKAWPVAHTPADVTVTDVATGVLFAGDLLFHRHTPALDGSLRGWQGVMEELTALKVKKVVPGHGGPVLDWPSGASAQRDYLRTLAHDTREAIAKGQRMAAAVQTIAESEAEKWELFEDFNPRNATVAFTELEWE